MRHPSATFKPGDLVVSRKSHDLGGYLFRVEEIYPARPETFHKPTVACVNLRPIVPIRDPAEEAHDKSSRRGGRYIYLCDEMQLFSQPAQMRLFQ